MIHYSKRYVAKKVTTAASLLVIFVFLGVFTPIQLLPVIFSNVPTLDHVRADNAEVVIVSENRNLSSGESFSLTLHSKHGAFEFFSLSYSCSAGVVLWHNNSGGQQMIECDETYEFTNSNLTQIISVDTQSEDPVYFPLSLAFLNTTTLEVNRDSSMIISVNTSAENSLSDRGIVKVFRN